MDFFIGGHFFHEHFATALTLFKKMLVGGVDFQESWSAGIYPRIAVPYVFVTFWAEISVSGDVAGAQPWISSSAVTFFMEVLHPR